ncbi:MAG: SRPBCC domain-containing protein [Oligoflexia bacterium]|nr:SRPBCC domain-containing protein [Oligoflexia bacterium]
MGLWKTYWITMALRQVWTDIEINSTPEKVWEVLIDFSKFNQWNPLFNFIEGDPSKHGSPLREHIFLFGRGGPMVKWRSKVMIYNPPYEFAWRGHVWFRQFGLGEHHYQIIPLGENKVRFVHWELFFGFFPTLFFKYFMKKKTTLLFHQMNLAIKNRVENLI